MALPRNPSERGRAMTARKRLPNRRHAETFELTVGGLRYVCTVGRLVDGRIGELFLSNHKIKQRRRYERARRGRLQALHHHRVG